MSRYLGLRSVSCCLAQIMICMQVITVFIIVMVKGVGFIEFTYSSRFHIFNLDFNVLLQIYFMHFKVIL
jgi:hypothetical protein